MRHIAISKSQSLKVAIDRERSVINKTIKRIERLGMFIESIKYITNFMPNKIHIWGKSLIMKSGANRLSNIDDSI
jgi:hypothetical protein